MAGSPWSGSDGPVSRASVARLALLSVEEDEVEPLLPARRPERDLEGKTRAAESPPEIRLPAAHDPAARIHAEERHRGPGDGAGPGFHHAGDPDGGRLLRERPAKREPSLVATVRKISGDRERGAPRRTRCCVILCERGVLAQSPV
jgi:hypothetical protein